jgi:hypothetical protein
MGLPKRAGGASDEKDFYKLLHPELRRRLTYLMDDLRERGWDPLIPEVFGVEGTGYRSPADQAQLKAKHPERTGSGSRSFHMIRASDGTPESMAVHITDRSLLGRNPRRGDAFVEDLEALAERHGLRTGNRWKEPWDPLHVQLYENDQLKSVLQGARPDYLNPRAHLLPPSLGTRPSQLLPKIPNPFDPGRFKLNQGFGWPPKTNLPAPPPITRKDWDSGKWMRLVPPPFGGARSEPPPWAQSPPPFRSSPPPGIGFKGFGLSNTIPWRVCTGIGPGPNYDALTRRLTPPAISLAAASGGAFRPFSSALNLGNLQLRPPNFGA